MLMCDQFYIWRFDSNRQTCVCYNKSAELTTIGHPFSELHDLVSNRSLKRRKHQSLKLNGINDAIFIISIT